MFTFPNDWLPIPNTLESRRIIKNSFMLALSLNMCCESLAQVFYDLMNRVNVMWCEYFWCVQWAFILGRFKNNLEFQSRCMSMSVRVSLSRTFLGEFIQTYPSRVIVEWITCMHICIQINAYAPREHSEIQLVVIDSQQHFTFPTKKFNLEYFFLALLDDENKISFTQLHINKSFAF